MFTWVVKKCLNLTFKVNFLCQKSFESFCTISRAFFSLSLKTSIFEPLCFLKWCTIFWLSMWTSVTVKSKNYFHFIDFFAKIFIFMHFCFQDKTYITKMHLIQLWINNIFLLRIISSFFYQGTELISQICQKISKVNIFWYS